MNYAKYMQHKQLEKAEVVFFCYFFLPWLLKML